MYHKSLLILALSHPFHLLHRTLSLVADDVIGFRVYCRVALLEYSDPSFKSESQFDQAKFPFTQSKFCLYSLFVSSFTEVSRLTDMFLEPKVKHNNNIIKRKAKEQKPPIIEG